MSNTYILYNNQKIPEPTPFVLLERENLYYNQYWGNSDKITLQGQITGYGCSPFNEIISGQEKILNIFSRNFNNFQIFEPSININTWGSDLALPYSKFQFNRNTFDSSFGSSVSINENGNYVSIGAPRTNRETGAAYISYSINNTWTNLYSLTGNTGYFFGNLSKINSSGNVAFVLSQFNTGEISSGIVNIYTGKENNWKLVNRITGLNNSGLNISSLDCNNDSNILFLGTRYDIQALNNTEENGALYIFTGNNYNFIFCQKITGEKQTGAFGYSLSSSSDGKTIIVSSPFSDEGTGSALIITGNSKRWEKAFELSGFSNSNSNFGHSTAINSFGDIIFLSNLYDNNGTGSVHVFTGSGNFWKQAFKISGSNEDVNFGQDISCNKSGDIIAITSNDINNLGIVNVFTRKENIWNKALKIMDDEFITFNEGFGIPTSINGSGNKILIAAANFGQEYEQGQGLPISTGKVYIYEQEFNYEKIYENSGIIIRSINFDNSNYAGIVDYSIELNSTKVSGNVIDPVNEFQFTENENKTVTLSHNVSAKGINTSLSPIKSNALNNAISFVRSNTGLANIPSTRFISGDINRFYLQNFSESIDRLNAIYSVQETYINNYLDNSLSGNLTYSLDINSGSESNFVEINIRGQYKGPKNGDISNLRNSLNITGLISGTYSGYFNPTPIQYNITENTGENSINFDYSFDNINLPNPYYRYNSSITKDEIQQIYNVQIQGEIIARGNRNYRYFLSTGNIINLTGQFISVASGILTGFKDFNGDTYLSNLRLLNITIDENPNNGTVSANASYDDKYMPTGNATDASYNISVSAPRWYMNNQPTCNIKGFHIINDFDITTLPKISVNTSLKYKNLTGLNNENILRSEIKNITNNIIPNNYNFNTKLQDSESYTKKINNFNSITEISYKLDKVDLSNQNGLLPKFNTI